MNGNIRVGNLFGIPFFVNPSWFFVLAWVTWSYGSGLSAQFPMLGGALPLLLGLVAALLLFASVLAHELGHSFAAMKQGINVKSITLFLFGGLASLEKESDTPAAAFWVAIAGPLVSLVLFALFTGINLVVPLSGPLGAILSLLATINLILALFNLIPGLPLDGGNILKALVWKVTGNPYKGVVFASRVGQVLGWIAIASAFLPLLLYGTFGSLWNLLIGGFLLQNAGRMAQSATIQEKLSSLTAADAVVPNGPVVAANLSLRELANNYIIGQSRWTRFLVTNEEGQFIGMISVDALKTIPTSQWNQATVSELTQPTENLITVKSSQSLLEVVQLLEQQKLTQLPVVRDNGVLVGILEKATVIELMQKRFQPNPA